MDMSTTEQEALEARAAKLREVVNAPTERERAARELMEVERRLAEEQQAAASRKAQARMLALTRASGSLRAQYEEDQQRFRDALTSLDEAIATLNARYEKLVALEFEARDLRDDFALPLPEFAGLKSETRPLPPAELVRVETSVRIATWDDYVRQRRVHDKVRARERGAR